MTTDDMVSNPTRLTNQYPNAYSDFYGSDTPCVFKSGAAWEVRKGPEAQGIFREARPVYDHPIGQNWHSIGESVYNKLDTIGVEWTSINPLAYANAGEAQPFCPLIISIGVKPDSLLYEAAVAAAGVVKEILAEAGFPDIEVAFVESVVTRSVATSPKLLSFDPLIDDIPDLRKPFTTTLGISIAPLKYPYYEGTGTLYYRLGKNSKRIALLTCAHVARPESEYPNISMTQKAKGKAREEIVALGTMAYNNAVKELMSTISRHVYCIEVWNSVLERLGEPVEGENVNFAKKRKEHLASIADSTKKIQEINELHTEVTKYHTTPEQRVIGFVLHSAKYEINVDAPECGFTKDWAFIELYHNKINWESFKGNQVYVAGNLSISDFGDLLFPQVTDRANFHYPKDGLLQAYGVVQDEEIRNPHHLDVFGRECLLVIKNGLGTGTTVGRANGLESFTREYDENGIALTSIELAVLTYDRVRGTFSAPGDSGSVVLARDGRIVGILTGGTAPRGFWYHDITFLTPYWWLEKQIKAKYPGCFLYEVVP